MNVLVIGSGGREHAIIKALKKNNHITTIYATPGNGGIAQDAICLPVDACDIPGMCKICKQYCISFAVVTPDDPLVAGMVDALQAIGVQTFGPSQLAARIEGSKIYAKQLMQRYHIPTARYAVFEQAQLAMNYLRQQTHFPIVIKADGLALGKGVIIAYTMTQALEAVKSMMIEKQFGSSGSQIVIEEYLTGPEVSVLTFCDGKTIAPMVSVMDHKRALNGDQGLNTGGMGTIAPNPFYSEELANRCMQEIFLPTLQALNAEQCPFQGCLYFGLILTADGPKVIEYNCRFGDPETQVVLPLLETDLFTIFQAVAQQKLNQIEIKFSKQSAACLVLTSEGYPQTYQTGYSITGTNQWDHQENVWIYHAGTILVDGRLQTNGGRVLGIATTATTLQEALNQAYHYAETISFQNKYYRTDIGERALSFYHSNLSKT